MLLAGVVGFSPLNFAVSVAVARGVRYFGEGLLAVWYGDLAIEYIRSHGPLISLGLMATVILGGVGYGVWRYIQGRKALELSSDGLD